MTHFPGLIINPRFFVCVNPECQIGVSSWSEMGKPSGCKCQFCGQETRETKSEPLDTPQYVKSKGGRPTLSATEDNVKVEIIMPSSLSRKLDRLADGNRSAWIRQAIEAA